MRRVVIVMILVFILASQVNAMEIEAPEVPQSGISFMPETTDSFGQGLIEVVTDGLQYLVPALKDACRVCFSMVCIVLVVSLPRAFSGNIQKVTELIGAVALGAILLESSGSMVSLAADTVSQISEYGRLLLPVMTTAMAAQGGITASAALYAGTAMFDALVCALISKLLIPLLYMFLALAVAYSAIGEEMLKKLRDTLKGFLTWVLKTVLYVFTGYISITGVISGTTDAAVMKAAKLTISGAVPVVGGILSDATGAVLVGIGTMKNAAGLYGLFAILSIAMGPFLKIGAQYLVLKLTAALCGIFGNKQTNELIGDVSTAMGFLLGMTGTVSVMLLISTVCFMKGVG